MRSCLLIIFTCVIFAGQSLAIKIQNLPFVSDFHIGLVTGIGTGMNIGFDAGFNLGMLKLGPEIEQVITDVDHSAGVNMTRVGGCFNWPLNGFLAIKGHAGFFNFQVKNSDIRYSSNGVNYIFAAGTQTYPGSYQAVSLDYLWQEFLISPKFVTNQIENGPRINEIDLNIGRSF